MKKGGHSGGFTVVETLIVLTVSAMLAASALIFINGRQNKTQFQTGINNLQQQMQQVINQAISGYYPGVGNISCSVYPAGAKPQITNTNNDRGTNDGCIFVGKAVVLGPNFGNVGGIKDDYRVYSLIGTRTDSSGGDVQTPSKANIIPIAQTAAIGGTNTSFNESGYVESKPLENGIAYQWISYDGVKSATDGPQTVFAIVSNLAGYSGSGLTSKSQSYSLYPFGDGVHPVDWDLLTTRTQLANKMWTQNIKNTSPYKQVQICFASGSTDQSGLITIGDDRSDVSAGGLGVSLRIYGDKVCS